MFYSPSAKGFFDGAIHGTNIPADAVEISREQHAALMQAQSEGKRIKSDENGMPIAVDPPGPTPAEIWERIKAERDRRKYAGVKVGAHWFHSDDPSRIQQIGLVMMGASMPAGIQWKTLTADDAAPVFVEMTPELARQIFDAAAAHDQAVFAAAEAHRVAMEQSADPANYDYSTGWPPAFGDPDPEV